MKKRVHVSAWLIAVVAVLPARAAELTNACTVSVENRSAPVQDSGSWVIPGVPATGAPLRVRATCVEAGVTRSGQSDWFRLAPDEILEVAEIHFDAPAAIPLALTLSSAVTPLRAVGETAQLLVTARYADGTTRDLTASAAGTTYTSSNPAIVTVDAEGLAAARSSGVVLVTAANEGSVAILRVEVVVSGDSDGDGLPDDWELANGFDPNDSIDAMDDPDRDALSTVDEYGLGTDPGSPDSDGDQLEDGEEVLQTGTNPLLRDTDGDQVSDGLEVVAGSNPLDDLSVNLQPILSGMALEPATVTIVVNAIVGEGTRQLRVTADLIDGSRIDATRRLYGTSYASSDLAIASFGAEDGRVFGGQPGSATVTASIGARSAACAVTVQTFTPQMLAFLPIPGAPWALALGGDHVYVAAGAAGLQVIDVSDPERPAIVASLPTPGAATDVALDGGYLYVIDQLGELQVVDVSSPTAPFVAGRLRLTVSNQAEIYGVRLVVRNGRAFVVDGGDLHIVDVIAPQAMTVLGSLTLDGAMGLDVDEAGRYAVVARGALGLSVFDVANPALPVAVGHTHTRGTTSGAADVVIRNRLAYVADGRGPLEQPLGGVKVVDFTRPETPFVLGSSGDRFGIVALALDDEFVLGADYFFYNSVPIFHAAPEAPAFRGEIDFGQGRTFRDDNGTAVAVDRGLVFMLGSPCIGPCSGGGGLYVGRYRVAEDVAGQAPTVNVTQPTDNDSVLERRPFLIAAEASDDARVVGVRFFTAGEELGFDYTVPYQAVAVAPLDQQQVTVSAVALDAGGNQGAPDQVTVQVAADPDPVATILYPLSGDVFVEGTSLQVLVEATDDEEVADVELSLDGSSQGVRASPPYSFAVTLPRGVGSAELTAVATDRIGNVASSPLVRLDLLADQPPFVAFVEPSAAREVVGGGLVTVRLGATDDVGVTSLSLQANEQPVSPRTGELAVFDVNIPLGIAELRLRAVAIDTATQEVASELVLPVVSSDPLTTVIGSASRDSLPVAGARIACGGAIGSSATDGTFSIPGVPTASGTIRCSASYTDAGGAVLSGFSQAAVPVPGGVTDVGAIRLTSSSAFLYPGPQLAWDTEPRQVVAADFDENGRLDLVTAGGFSTILALGQASGEFRVETLDVPASAVAVGDFDGDGHLDLAAADFDNQRVSVLPGRGDGTFDEASSFAVAGAPTALAAGDFDRDGDEDLLVSAQGVGVWLGNGDGTFSLLQLLSTGGELAVTNTDRDGVLDFIAGDSQLSVYEGNGDGSFTFRSSAGFVSRPRGLVTADFDADGWVDVAVGDTRFNRVQVYRALGNGSYQLTADLPVVDDPNGLCTADVDRNGTVDLLLAVRNESRIALLSGSGDGTFGSTTLVPAGRRLNGCTTGDLNGDGLLDVATADTGITLLFGTGGLVFDVFEEIPALALPVAPLLVDLNRDGAMDLLYSLLNTNEVAARLGRGDGTFAAERRYQAGAEPWLTMTVDLNADGFPDLVTVHDDDADLGVRLGVGDGTLGAERRVPLGTCPGPVSAGDLNGDGQVDLVVVDYCDNAASILLGDGAGDFAPRVQVATGPFPTATALADVNRDGRLDLIVSADRMNAVASSKDMATARLDARARRRLGPERWNRAAARSSLVKAGGGGELGLYLGDGQGGFSPPILIGFEKLLQRVAVRDLNGDGSPDLVTQNGGTFPEDVSVALGRGNGTFDPEVRYWPGVLFPQSLEFGDVNGDGNLDLLIPAQSSDHVAILLGRGDGTFYPVQHYAGGECVSGVAIGDVNGDSKVDLAMTNLCADSISLLLHK